MKIIEKITESVFFKTLIEKINDLIGNSNECITELTKIDTQLGEKINEYMEEHPETTTVRDNSLTKEKFSEKLRLETLNSYATPQMYGAKGDNVTDDTEAIQACIDANDKIFFPTGKYKITKPLRIGSNKHIEGQGNYYTRIVCVNCDAFHFVDGNPSNTSDNSSITGIFSNISIWGDMTQSQFNGTDEITKRNRCFVMPTDDAEATDKAYIVADWIFDHIYVRGFTGEFFVSNGTGHINNIIIQNSGFTFGGSNCIEFLHDNTNQVNNITIRSSNISTFLGNGINITGNNISIAECTIQAVTHGICVDPSLSKTAFTEILAHGTKGLNIFSNYFEQIKKNYIYMKPIFISGAGGFYGQISGVSIIGNFGVLMLNSNNTAENNLLPAIQFETDYDNVFSTLYNAGGQSLIGGLLYASNAFGVRSNKVLINGGGILSEDCVFYMDGAAGESVTPYTYKNMNNATVISRRKKKTDTLKLYDGYVSSNAEVTTDGVKLLPNSKLICKIDKNSLSYMHVVINVKESGTNRGKLKIIMHSKNAEPRTLIDVNISASIDKEYKQDDSTGHKHFNPDKIPFSEIEYFEFVLESGDYTLMVNNPELIYHES